MVAMATNSNITVPQKYTAKYKNVGYGWDTSHPTTISKKFIILIYHYLHTVPVKTAGKSSDNGFKLLPDRKLLIHSKDETSSGGPKTRDVCKSCVGLIVITFGTVEYEGSGSKQWQIHRIHIALQDVCD